MIAIGAPIIDNGHSNGKLFDVEGIMTPGLVIMSETIKNIPPNNAVIGITYRCFEVLHIILAIIGQVIPTKAIGPVNATIVAVKIQDNIISQVLKFFIFTPTLTA